MNIIWQWPQITIAAMHGLIILLNLLLNGQERTARGKYNAGWTILFVIGINVVYYYGGFWTETRP